MPEKTPLTPEQLKKLAEFRASKKGATPTSTSGQTMNTFTPGTQAWLEKKQKEGYTPLVSGINAGIRQANQPQTKGEDNLFGGIKWNKEEQEDFKRRHPWVFQQKPDFDPHKKADAQWFQEEFNNQHPGYFNQKDERGNLIPGTSINGAFGQHTFSTPGVIKEEKPAAPLANTSLVKDTTQIPLKSTGIKGENTQAPANFWLQDIVKTTGAAADQYRINKYMPWQAPYNPYVPQATFYDPTRELAANAEQANIADQTAAMFGAPQQLSARMSQVQGQAGAQAANILGKYNNMNVSASNQNEQQRTGVLNEANQWNADRATNLYDKTVQTNQNFDNAKAMARQQVRGSFIDALTNRGQTQALNSLFPQYQVNPLTGGTVNFTEGKKTKAEGSSDDATIARWQKYAPIAKSLGVKVSDILGKSKGEDDDDESELEKRMRFLQAAYKGQ